jgi:hypothetical protein
LTGIVGILLDGGGQFLHGRGGLFQGAGLLLGTRRQVQVAGGDFGGGGIDGIAALAHFGHDAVQVVIHGLERRQQCTGFILGGIVDLHRQVAGGHRVATCTASLSGRVMERVISSAHSTERRIATQKARAPY